MSDPTDPVLNAVRVWLERAVIGLNLCPFAKSVHAKGQIRWVRSDATRLADLTETLRHELELLARTDPDAVDTTVLVVPGLFADFLDFNDYLGEADALLSRLDLEGVLQIASFHPAYRFAGVDADDITNYTNRAPYPVIHLLREASVERAVQAFPEAEAIFERNMETLQALGHVGWAALAVGPPEGAR